MSGFNGTGDPKDTCENEVTRLETRVRELEEENRGLSRTLVDGNDGLLAQEARIKELEDALRSTNNYLTGLLARAGFDGALTRLIANQKVLDRK